MRIMHEYRKGVMFLRLNGTLTKRTYKKFEDIINKIVIDEKFNNIVINLSNIKSIDMKGISSLYYIYEILKKEKGRIFICLENNDKIKSILKKEKILNYIHEIENEIIAFKIVQV